MSAYRRGVLAPSYEHGYNGRQSRIREGIVLDLVSLDNEGERVRCSTQTMAAVCGPHYDSSKISDVVNIYKNKLDAAAAYSSYDISNLKPKTNSMESQVDQLVAQYKAMQESGELARILEMHKKIK